ncbi:MAG: DUF4250 domain-containing protein [Culicoidibacterales bacterium]
MDVRMTLEQFLKTDPAIAMSWLNMKLRDEYRDLAELCESTGFETEDVVAKMTAYGYEYVASLNQFRPSEAIEH